MSIVKTFWVENLYIYDWMLSASATGPCPAHGERHLAERSLGTRTRDGGPGDYIFDLVCACGYTFGKASTVRWGAPRYRRLDNGAELRGKLPPGALYVAWERRESQEEGFGLDGKMVVCVLPNGDHWHIDSRASNCTMKTDKAHRCWVRHGTVGQVIHVDKNGNTCQAGAGSIAVDGWHGFLHNGELREV